MVFVDDMKVDKEAQEAKDCDGDADDDDDVFLVEWAVHPLMDMAIKISI